MQLAVLEHSPDVSRHARTPVPRASSTSRMLIFWSSHYGKATLGTLKLSMSSEDERVAHRGRRIQVL